MRTETEPELLIKNRVENFVLLRDNAVLINIFESASLYFEIRVKFIIRVIAQISCTNYLRLEKYWQANNSLMFSTEEPAEAAKL